MLSMKFISVMSKAEFSVSHDPSEIIIICSSESSF